MREVLRPARERGRHIIAAGTLSALAFIGLSGCSEQQDASWKLTVDCADEQELNTRNFRNQGPIHTFEMRCGEDAVPSSVEIINSPQLEKGGTTINSDFVVNIHATDRTGFLETGTPDLAIVDEDMFTKVVVDGASSLDRVNITTQE